MRRNKIVPSYFSHKQLAEVAARTSDAYQFAGHITAAVREGLDPSRLSSSDRTLLNEAGVELSSLKDDFIRYKLSHEPTIDEPPYNSPQNVDLKVFEDRFLRAVYRPFGSYPPADYELKRRMHELHKLGIKAHNYSHLKGRDLFNFWHTLTARVTTEVKTHQGDDFVANAKRSYEDNPYA